jgi:hypothetical protein
MSLRRYAAKRDFSEPEIVKALEEVGAKVYRKLPIDLLVYFRGRFHCLEVKTPGEPKHSSKRCKDQDAFIAETGTPIVKTPEEAIVALIRS